MMSIPSKFYRLLARVYMKLPWRDEMESGFLRKTFVRGYSINVGLYSYGCFDRDRFTPFMKIGRYCSFSRTCRRVNANHTMDQLSLHPFFYNAKFKIVPREQVVRSSCEIEDDVWVGHNVVILPNVTKVGRGSVLAAGAVITKNVPRYCVVAGVPGKVISKRFDDETIEKIEASRWWELPKESLGSLVRDHWDWVRSPATMPSGAIANYITENSVL